MTHEFHNPDNLTPEQIGEGYRLLLKSEIKPRPENREINAWLGRFRRWTDHNDSMCVGSSQDLTYRVPLSTWPLPEPEIKWKAEREAFARGETVEAQLTSGWAPDTWIPLDANFERDWNTLFAARIKPWTLGNSVNGFTLGKGQQWHRLDWTREMLPEGWRPHTDGEVNGDGDQWLSQSGWRNVAAQEGGSSSGPFCAHCRTRRPLPTPKASHACPPVKHPEAQELQERFAEPAWIPWHGGKCPLKDEEVEEWEPQYRHPGGMGPRDFKPSQYRWSHSNQGGDIIAYRVLKWKKPQGQHGPAGQPDRLGPSVSLPPIETFSAAMESVTKQESPPTDNDSWECLLRTNAQLGKKVVELEKDSDFWKSRYEDAINATSFIQKEKESLGLLVGQDTVTDGIPALRRQRNELQSKLTAAQARLEFELVKTSTSNWWKTEIVRRGYGTWETTTDGQVWFKWKENNPYNHEK